MNKLQTTAGALWTAIEGVLAVGTITVAPVAVPGLPQWAGGLAGVGLAVGVFLAKHYAVAAEARSLADAVRAGVDAMDDAIDTAVPAAAPAAPVVPLQPGPTP
jgi:hypothetical protein